MVPCVFVWPFSVLPFLSGLGPSAVGREPAAAGDSARTTWALVPPNPNELIPAIRGLPLIGIQACRCARDL